VLYAASPSAAPSAAVPSAAAPSAAPPFAAPTAAPTPATPSALLSSAIASEPTAVVSARTPEPEKPSQSVAQLDLGMSTGSAANWGVREVVEKKSSPSAPEAPPVASPPVAATMSIDPLASANMTPVPSSVAAPMAPPPPAAPAEPEVPRLSDDVELAIIPARASPAREFKVEARPKPYEVPPDVEFNGGLLRQVRMARGLSLSQLAERTRIGTKHLENVEADRYDALPAVVYLRGILMNLARELGLDGLRVSKSYLAFVEAHRSKG
jgi:hypothetical protein